MFAQLPALINQAVQHFQQGKLPQASQLLKQALDLQPRNFDALHILGVIRAMQGERGEAIELFRKALSINKSNSFLHFNLAKALSESGLETEALHHHHKTTQLAPDHAEAWLGYGRTLANLQQYGNAIAAYDRALKINPSYAGAWNNKGLAQNQLQMQREALTSLDQAIALAPSLAEAHFNKGVVLDDLERYDEALVCYDHALRLQPGYAQASNNKGVALTALGRPRDSLVCYDHALTLQPQYAQAWNNKGSALLEMGEELLARTCYEQAIALQPDYPDAQVSLSHILLSQGDYTHAWDRFEYRWQSKEQAPRRLQTNKPAWAGTANPEPLLLWGEQGIGDQVLYAGILPDVAAFPQKKYVALDRRLIPLFARSLPGFEFVDLEWVNDTLDFSEHLPLGSLPRYFRLTPESFDAARHPYLVADPVRTAALRQKIAQPGKRVCGVSWSSSRKSIGTQKSVRLAQMLAPLASEQLHFVNLQYGDTAAERSSLQAQHGVVLQNVDEVDNFNDIDGLAALIEACDIVITTSNSTAHLSGALGKETLLLLPSGKGKLWYWAEHAGRNVWYPSIKIFTQATPGDWQQPLDRIKKFLKDQSWT